MAELHSELELHADLEQRLARFHASETPLPQYVTNLFDPTLALYAFADMCLGREISMCRRQKLCSCAKPCPCVGKQDCQCAAGKVGKKPKPIKRCPCTAQEKCTCPVACICDDDYFVDLKLVNASVLSNCRFVLEFSAPESLKAHKL